MVIEPILAVVLLTGIAIGALVGWLAGRPALVRAQTELEKDRAAHAERLRGYEDSQVRLRDTFHALSADALHSNNQQFLDLAEGRLREARTQATADIDTRKKAIEDLLTPLQKTLEHVDREIQDAERRRTESGAQLAERLAALDATGQNLRSETTRLVDALKRPGVRGRWGELQLRRVVELAGMIERCDFDEQLTVSADERRMRPDVIVRLPGGKHVVIDAKAPLDAYLKALEAPDDTTRAALLADHARQVRTHLVQLAAKGYAAHVQPGPDFVVMFLPGEMFFSAALEQDPGLIEYGVELRVIPASPTTLVAMLKAIAYGWQQQAVAENARQISELGRSLYESVRKLGTHFDVLGTKLKGALDAYNGAVGSLEGNVLVKARRFKDLQAAGGSESVEALEPIDRVPRMLQAPELLEGLPFADASEPQVPEGDVGNAGNVGDLNGLELPLLDASAQDSSDTDLASETSAALTTTV